MTLRGDIQGLWVRDWIKTPDFEDHTTRVYWAQVGDTYADVRIPLERPDLGKATSLGDLDTTALLQLAQAEGFAGHTTLTATQCTWHRTINWHGTPTALDVGEISFDAKGRLVETGAHADYTELWSPRRDPDLRCWVFSAGGYDGFLASVGSVGVLGIGRPDKAATQPVIDALGGDAPRKDIVALFEGIHAFGHWTAETFVADLATNPFAQGEPLVTITGTTLLWHRTGFDGTRQDVRFNV